MKFQFNLFCKILVVILVNLQVLVEATNKCIWAVGSVKCRHDPSKQANVEVRAYDRDGISILKLIDPDDLMGVTFTEDDGTFKLDGCASDMDWIPGIENPPDPYIRITHYCNSDEGDMLELPEFNTFVPNTHDVGVIELDDVDNAHNVEGTKDKYNYRTHSRNKTPDAEMKDILRLLPASGIRSKDTEVDAKNRKKTIFDTTPHVGIDDTEETSTTGENDAHVTVFNDFDSDKENQAKKDIQDDMPLFFPSSFSSSSMQKKWKDQRERDRYTLQNANNNGGAEITTVTLPDREVALSDAAKVERSQTLN